MALIDNLVSYWKLDESSGDASDSTASVKTLTNTGTTTYAAAKINNGADLGTVNTTKYLGRTGYVISDGAVSFSLWVKQRTEIAAGIQTFISSGSESTAFRVDYEYNSGTRRLALVRSRNNRTNETTYYNITLGTANFYHLVGTYDGANIVLYVNGVNVSTTTSSLNGTTNWSPGGGFFTLGVARDANLGTVGQYSSSYIDEVAVWNRGITQSDVNNLYNSGSGFAYPLVGYSISVVAGTFLVEVKSARLFFGNMTNTSKPTTSITNISK
jgi:hypothetical protein